MKRRQSSSCHGRATHCTATGRPSAPVTACKQTQKPLSLQPACRVQSAASPCWPRVELQLSYVCLKPDGHSNGRKFDLIHRQPVCSSVQLKTIWPLIDWLVEVMNILRSCIQKQVQTTNMVTLILRCYFVTQSTGTEMIQYLLELRYTVGLYWHNCYVFQSLYSSSRWFIFLTSLKNPSKISW